MASSSPPQPISVLFVCLGNICRSTMAEGIFRALVSKQPYKDLVATVDSCGTGAYHTGDSPDSRTMSTLADNGITDYSHAARKVQPEDFDRFDYVFAMDRSNLRDLKAMQSRRAKGPGRAHVLLFGEYAGTGKTRAEEVGDPYYGARDGFEIAYEQCMRFSKNFLRQVFPDVEA